MPDIEHIISHAISHRASDIHIDPEVDHVTIKERIDGVIYEVSTFPKERLSEIIAQIKILSGMRIDEHFKPQDGRWGSDVVDIRVSVLPTIHGENAVLRVLKKNETIRSLDDLGMNVYQKMVIEKTLSRDKGMILVSGPTGSGKTTTLYTLLSHFIEQKKIIVTIEDPVEYTVQGVRQIGIRHGHMNFANGLRAILRQDPDVIMIGEIRDTETATVAVNAALTGHVVISTIHTESAKAVEARLIDMGIPSFQIKAISLVAIAQRLLRKVCNACIGNGCTNCEERGYNGRTAIYEIKTGITQYETLQDHAQKLVTKNETTQAEVERVLGKGGFL